MKLSGINGLSKLFSDYPIHIGFPRLITDPQHYIFNQFYLPYPFLEWVPPVEVTTYNLLLELLFVSTILFTFGLCTRLTGKITLLLYVYMFLSSQFFYEHNTYLLLTTIAVLAFSKSGEHYSTDAFLRKRKPRETTFLPLAILQLTLIFMYLGSLAHKLNYGWFRGEVIQKLIETQNIFGSAANLYFVYISPQFASFIILMLLLSIIFFLVTKQNIIWAFIPALALHLGMDSMMALSVYSYISLALFISFLPPDLETETVKKA